MITSCEKDKLIELETSSEINLQSISDSLSDGRIYFSSKELLETTISNFEDSTEEELFESMGSFYNQGFLSLRPPAYEEIEVEILSQYEVRVGTFFNDFGQILTEEEVYERIDDTQFVVGSDVFAAFLNENGEIIIDDKIYKYTDVGLFIVNKTQYGILNTFLNENNISTNLIIPTNQNAIESFASLIPNRGVTLLEDGDIKFFVAECIDDIHQKSSGYLSPCGNSGGGWPPNPNPNPQGPLTGYQDFANSVEVCSDNSGWTSFLFGVNRICIDRYTSDRRVKTQVLVNEFVFPDVDIYIVQSKVRHQRKKLGIWWRKKADVVVLDVSAIQLEYDYSSLIASGFPNLNPTSVKYSVEPTLSTFNVDTDIWTNDNGTQGYSFISNSSWSPNIPTIFHDDLIIEAFKMGYEKDNGELNEDFWTSVWNSAKVQLKALTNDPYYENPLNVTLLANYPDIKNLMIQRSYFSYCTNCRNRKKTFDFDGSFNVKLLYEATSGDFDYSSSTGILVTPKLAGAAMVGAVKVNGTWHGSRIHYNMGDN